MTCAGLYPGIGAGVDIGVDAGVDTGVDAGGGAKGCADMGVAEAVGHAGPVAVALVGAMVEAKAVASAGVAMVVLCTDPTDSGGDSVPDIPVEPLETAAATS